MSPLPRRGRSDGHGSGQQIGKESLEPPSAMRGELGPDRRQWIWRWGRGRGRGWGRGGVGGGGGGPGGGGGRGGGGGGGGRGGHVDWFVDEHKLPPWSP